MFISPRFVITFVPGNTQEPPPVVPDADSIPSAYSIKVAPPAYALAFACKPTELTSKKSVIRPPD